MKKLLYFAALATVACAVIMSSCKKDDEPSLVLSDAADRTQIAYADQSTSGDFTFTASDVWTITVMETTVYTRASGVSWITLVENGTERYAGPAGTYSFSILLESNFTGKTRTATITVSCISKTEVINVTQDSKTQSGQTLTTTVSVAAQSGELKAATAGTATFAVTTTGIDNGKAGTVEWFSADGETVSTAPAGISADVSAVANNSATVTITATAATVQGSYYFKTTIDGTVSAVATLTIGPPIMTTGDDPNYNIPAMTAGTPITDIDLSGAISGGIEPYMFAVTDGVLPDGLTLDSVTGIISGTPETAGTAGTITVTVTDSTEPKAQTVTITIAYGEIKPASTYSISASALASFGSVYTEYSQPAVQTVTITNTGTGAVTIAQPTATNYLIGTLSATQLATGEKATFTVQPKAGLSVNTYNETITVTGSDGVKVNVNAQFAVTVAPTYSISASTLTSFDSQTEGYTTPPTAQTVTITNTGTDVVTLTQPVADKYDITALSTTTIAIGAKATFTVRPMVDLGVGTHNETITIKGTGGVTATVTARFIVTAYTYTIIALPTPLDFGSEIENYAQPAARTVTITNTGMGTVTLIQPTATNFDISNLDKTSIAAGTRATFTVRPKAGLGVGMKDETIIINGSSGAKATVKAEFSVTAHTNTLTATPSQLDFSSVIWDYASPPAAQTVTITNTGTVTVTLIQPTATNFDIGNLDKTAIDAGETATFTVQPKTGLVAEAWNETITVNGADGTKVTVTTQFSVTPKLVTASAITGVTSPMKGVIPSTAITNGTGYTALLTWDGNPAKFAASTEYTATITLTKANDNYTFAGNYTNATQIAAFTVNDAAAPVWVSNNGSTLVFKVTFPKTAGEDGITYPGGSDNDLDP